MVDKADDLDSPLWGARSIAAAANISECTAFHLLQNGLLPGVKIGKICTAPHAADCLSASLARMAGYRPSPLLLRPCRRRCRARASASLLPNATASRRVDDAQTPDHWRWPGARGRRQAKSS